MLPTVLGVSRRQHLLWNVSHWLSVNTASYFRRLEYSSTPFGEPYISKSAVSIEWKKEYVVNWCIWVGFYFSPWSWQLASILWSGVCLCVWGVYCGVWGGLHCSPPDRNSHCPSTNQLSPLLLRCRLQSSGLLWLQDNKGVIIGPSSRPSRTGGGKCLAIDDEIFWWLEIECM
jgi:hypothetical protein